MRKILCDRCGKEIASDRDVNVVILKFSKMDYEGHSLEFELCKLCFRAANNFIVHFETSA